MTSTLAFLTTQLAAKPAARVAAQSTAQQRAAQLAATSAANSSAQSSAQPATRSAHKISRDTVFLIGDTLPLLDFVGVLLAAYLGTLFYAGGNADALAAGILEGGGRAAIAAAVLAPFILCDRAFVSFASGGQTAALVRCYATRFLMFAGAVAAIGLASRELASLPRGWLALWFASSLAITAITRLLLVATLRRLERLGILAETIAVVGAGPRADRLVAELRKARRNSVEILGVFDDSGSDANGRRADGTVADLLELGKSRPMDWILVALPIADPRLPALVHRLKALSVPVGLCQTDAAGEVAATPLSAVPPAALGVVRTAIETVVPRWILTLLSLPLAALRILFIAVRESVAQPVPRSIVQPVRESVQPRAVQPRDRKAGRPPERRAPTAFALDNYDLAGFTGVAARFGQERYGYVVTPNADHLIRLDQDASSRALYTDADYVLLDSRFISRLLRFTRGIALPVCTGSDLTATLLDKVITHDDRLVLIGGSAELAARLRQRYGLKALAHFDPPMGLLKDPVAMEACLRFVEAHSPFRYCLLAVGAPQQEVIAQRLKLRGVARGLALCIGGSIAFLTGKEKRAPLWLQRNGLEWLFRLCQSPARLARRYLIQGPRIFGLLRRTEFVLREAEPLS